MTEDEMMYVHHGHGYNLRTERVNHISCYDKIVVTDDVKWILVNL